MNTVYDCGTIRLPKVLNPAGNLTALENSISLPFDIRRVYFIYDVASGCDRGAHAHKELEQCIVAASGSFEVLLDDGSRTKVFRLDRPDIGLHVPPPMWRRLFNFSGGSVCLVLASRPYEEDDYIHDYETFEDYVASQ
jgi:oxalate decarboxylase/phosphoglucose isomerase-like protein (cupin superfamily)